MTAHAPSFPVPVVRAVGSRREVGRTHGAAVAGLVMGTLEWSLDELAKAGVSRSDALAGSARLLEHVAARCPDLLEEVHGIAEGSDLTVEEVGVINSRYELMNILGTPRPGGAECTVFGLTDERAPGRRAIVGQNVDLDSASAGLWVLLDVSADGAPRVATATLAGMLAQEGINSAGLALCGSMVLARGWRFGYPTRKFLRREVMEQSSVRDAVAVVRDCKTRASSHNLMLADTGGHLVDLETTVDEVAELEPISGVLVHSNHYATPEFVHHNAQLGSYLLNSKVRANRMYRLLDQTRGAVTIDTIKSCLRDHATEPRSICRHADTDETRSETNVSIISEPARGRMHVAFGPPCKSAYAIYDIARDAQ